MGTVLEIGSAVKNRASTFAKDHELKVEVCKERQVGAMVGGQGKSHACLYTLHVPQLGTHAPC